MEQEYTKTRVKIYQIQESKFTETFRDMPYSSKIENIKIGDSVVVDGIEYVHNGGGYGHDGDELYLSFCLMPKKEWLKMQEENRKRTAWRDGMQVVRNTLERRPFREGIEPERTLHPVYHLEDLC